MRYARAITVFFLLAALSACAPVSSQQVSQPAQASPEEEQQAPQVQTKNQNKAPLADEHFRLGVSHLKSNNPTQALKELLQAIQLAPNNDEINEALAQAYQLKKAYRLAEKHYLKAIELGGDNPRYKNNLASLYLLMKEWDKAIDYFGQAASNLLFMNPHVALAGKGFAYLQKKDYQSALAQFKEATAMAPRFAQGYYLQGETYKAMGDSDRARIALEKALEISPNYTQAIYLLGVLDLESEQIDSAIDRFERVVDLTPLSELGMQASDMLRALKKKKQSQPAGEG